VKAAPSAFGQEKDQKMLEPTMYYKRAAKGVGTQVNAELWVEYIIAEAGKPPEGYASLHDLTDTEAVELEKPRRGRKPKSETESAEDAGESDATDA
jgi:hypothetical protein